MMINIVLGFVLFVIVAGIAIQMAYSASVAISYIRWRHRVAVEWNLEPLLMSYVQVFALAMIDSLFRENFSERGPYGYWRGIGDWKVNKK